MWRGPPSFLTQLGTGLPWCLPGQLLHMVTCNDAVSSFSASVLTLFNLFSRAARLIVKPKPGQAATLFKTLSGLHSSLSVKPKAIMAYKVRHSLHSRFSHQGSYSPLCVLHVRSPTLSSLKAFVPALHSAWKAHLRDSLRGALPCFLQVSVRLSLYQRGLPQPPVTHTHASLTHHSASSL